MHINTPDKACTHLLAYYHTTSASSLLVSPHVPEYEQNYGFDSEADDTCSVTSRGSRKTRQDPGPAVRQKARKQTNDDDTSDDDSVRSMHESSPMRSHGRGRSPSISSVASGPYRRPRASSITSTDTNTVKNFLPHSEPEVSQIFTPNVRLSSNSPFLPGRVPDLTDPLQKLQIRSEADMFSALMNLISSDHGQQEAPVEPLWTAQPPMEQAVRITLEKLGNDRVRVLLADPNVIRQNPYLQVGVCHVLQLYYCIQ